MAFFSKKKGRRAEKIRIKMQRGVRDKYKLFTPLLLIKKEGNKHEKIK